MPTIYDKWHNVLRRCELFAGIAEQDIAKLTGCLGSYERVVPKGDIVIMPGETNGEFGIVLSGRIQGERTDSAGDRSVAGSVGAGGVFGEILASAVGRPATVTVAAAEDSTVLMMSFERVNVRCANNCGCHAALLHNMFRLIGGQYFQLADRIYCMTRRTLRSKLAAYFAVEAAAAGTDTLLLPFDRASLASYLGAERSALCRELARMKAEGLIDYYGRTIRILKKTT